MSDDIDPLTPRPMWGDGLPLCSEEKCAAYDGKRCSLIGFRPASHCEPELLSICEAFLHLAQCADYQKCDQKDEIERVRKNLQRGRKP